MNTVLFANKPTARVAQISVSVVVLKQKLFHVFHKNSFVYLPFMEQFKIFGQVLVIASMVGRVCKSVAPVPSWNSEVPTAFVVWWFLFFLKKNVKKKNKIPTLEH